MPSHQSTHFCLTFNGFEDVVDIDPEAPVVPQHPDERWCNWQLECGETGNIHVQAYLELRVKKTFTNVVQFFVRAGWPHPHVEARKGTREEARRYCEKDDETRLAGPWSRGEWHAGGQGARSDLHEAVAAMKEGGMSALINQHPTAFVKYSTGFERLRRAYQAEEEDEMTDEGFVPRVWQKHLLRKLDTEPNDRTIYWVTDSAGGQGKSRLSRHLQFEHGAVQLSGRLADMAYFYDKQRIVIFDITRAAADNTDHLYTFAEQLKNGIIFSSKYESRSKKFKPPHVVFFSNSTWDRTKFSHDRVKELDLAEDRWHVSVV